MQLLALVTLDEAIASSIPGASLGAILSQLSEFRTMTQTAQDRITAVESAEAGALTRVSVLEQQIADFTGKYADISAKYAADEIDAAAYRAEIDKLTADLNAAAQPPAPTPAAPATPTVVTPTPVLPAP